MDGWVIVGTKLDSKQLDKDLKNAEKKLQQYEKEAEKLTKQKVKVEIDLQPYEEQKRLIKETTNEMLSKSQTEEQVKNVLEIEKMQLEDLNKKYSKQLDSISSINKKIQTNVKNQELMKNQIDTISRKAKGLDVDFSKISKSTGDVIKKVGKWALAIFSVRGAYSAVRRAMSTLTQYNETLANQLNTINLMFASALEPLITRIVNLVYQLMSHINYIAKAWFGIDLFASATEKAMSKSAKSAKDMRKSLAGFDEMNVLNDNGTTGIGNIGMENIGIEPLPEGEIPNWLQWIVDNKDEVISGLLGIAGAITSIGLGLSFIKGLGIGVAIAGLALLIQGIIGFLNDPTFENFMHILEGIALTITGVAIAFAAWPVAIGAAIASVVLLVVENYNKIHKLFTNLIGWFETTFYGALKKLFGDKIATAIMTPINYVINYIKGRFEGFYGGVKDIVDGIVKMFKGDFTGGMRDVFDGLVKIVLAPFNSIISGINGVIRGINKIKFEVPDWVPDIGGKKLGFNIPTIPKIKLAVGGVVNLPGRGVPVGGAIGGERGAEGVIPLTNTQMMEQLGQTIGRYITVNNHITTTLNGRVIGRELKRSENESNFAFNR